MSTHTFRKIAVSASTIVGTFVVSQAAFAQALKDKITKGAADVNAGIGLTSKSLESTIGSLIQSAMGLIGILLVVYFIYAGYLWMTSQGDPKQTQKAKDIMLTATIGLAILLAAYAITTFVLNAVLSGAGL